jgi:hypothetical protein
LNFFEVKGSWLQMSLPLWATTPELQKLYGTAIGLSIPSELLVTQYATEGFVEGKKG